MGWSSGSVAALAAAILVAACANTPAASPSPTAAPVPAATSTTALTASPDPAASAYAPLPWEAAGEPAAIPGLLLGTVARVDGRLLATGSVSDPDRPVAKPLVRFEVLGDDGAWSTLPTAESPTGGWARAVTAADGQVIAVGCDHCTPSPEGTWRGFDGLSGRQAAIWWSDGGPWERIADAALEGAVLNSVAAFRGRFVAVGAREGRATVWTATDGRTWTEEPDGGDFVDAILVDVAATEDRLVAVGQLVGSDEEVAPAAWVSTDGTTWAGPVVLPAPAESAVRAIAATGSTFVAVGGLSTGSTAASHAWASGDGLTWDAAAFVGPIPSGPLTDVAGSSAGWLAVGVDVLAATMDPATRGDLRLLLGSRDGRTWSRLPVDGALADVDILRAVTWAGDRFALGASVIGADWAEDALIAQGLPSLAAPSGPVVTPAPAASAGVEIEREGRMTLHLASGLDVDLEGAAVCTGFRGGALGSVRANDLGMLAGFRIYAWLYVDPELYLEIGQGVEDPLPGVELMGYALGGGGTLSASPAPGAWAGRAEFRGLAGGAGGDPTPLPIGGPDGPAALDGTIAWNCGDEPIETGSGRLDGTLVLEGALAGTFELEGECLRTPPAEQLSAAGTLDDGREAYLLLAFVEDRLSLQVYPAGVDKVDAPHALAPVKIWLEGTSPTRGRFEAIFEMAGGIVHAEADFRCNR